jgi:hypothetical protein
VCAIVRLTLFGFLRHKSRHLIERQPLDAFGQLRPLAGFNLLQKRNSHPRGDHAIPQSTFQRPKVLGDLVLAAKCINWSHQSIPNILMV